MTVYDFEGWDHLAAAQFPSKGWSGSYTIGTGRFGTGQCFNVHNVSGVISKNLPSSQTTLYVGVAILNADQTNGDVVVLRNGGTNVLRLCRTTVGPAVFWQFKNAAGTVLGTGTTPLSSLSGWHYYEIKCVVSATVGQAELHIDGTGVEINVTNVNTGSSAVDNVGFNTPNGINSFDDYYAASAFLGECRVDTPAPLAEGADTAWTANTGTKVSRVNDGQPDDDTGYISSSTPGDRQTFTNTGVVPSAGTVFAVAMNIWARKDDAAARTLAPVIRIGGVDYDGSTSAGLSTGFLNYRQLYDANGPDAIAWSIARVNAMEIGVKEVA